MVSSGVQSASIALPDLTIDIFERLQWRASSLTPDMMASARRSFNLVFSMWSNRGVNLWRVSETPVRVPLSQGTLAYAVDASVISVLPESFIRQYSMMEAENVDPYIFVTEALSSTVTVNQPSHGLGEGQFIQVTTPVAVGGIIVQGFYAVEDVNSANQFTIDIGEEATSTATGGVVPQYSAFVDSDTINVTLPMHGLLAGDLYYVNVSTDVGGVTLSGQYTVLEVLTFNTFIFTIPSNATSNDTAYENDGLTQLAASNPQVLPVDRVLYPLSRADYSAIANKQQQGMPTSYWFNRQLQPSVWIWPVPDQNGPYEFNYYALRQIEDAVIQGYQTPDVPYRALEALASAVAAHLAMKWKPEMVGQLQAWADKMWMEFSAADRERVRFFITPEVSGYFNG